MTPTSSSFSLDTSIVLRLLIQQPAPLYDCAALFVEEKLAANEVVSISDHVLTEAYFALQSFYQISKADALLMLSSLHKEAGLQISNIAQEVFAIPQLASAKPGFVDRLIHGTVHASGQTLVTFEKAAKKLPRTVVLSV